MLRVFVTQGRKKQKHATDAKSTPAGKINKRTKAIAIAFKLDNPKVENGVCIIKSLNNGCRFELRM